MKKTLFILTVISLLMKVNVYSQSKELLIRYDEDAFKKAAEKVHYSDYNKEELYNRDLFRAYREQKGVALDFSEKDYRDAQTNVKTLTNEVSGYKTAMGEKEKELVDKENTVRKKDSIIDALTKEKIELNNQLLSKNKLEEQLKKKRDSITALETELSQSRQRESELETEKQNKDIIIKQLVNDTAKIGKEKRAAINEKSNKEAENKSLRSQLESKKNEIDSLRGKNNQLTNTNKGFQKAFDETKDAINDIYYANKDKPIAEMKPDQLDKARSKFEGMKSLLSIDQGLYKDLEGKVNEMSSWRVLVEPMKGAGQYLKGKYDDNKRNEYIRTISAVSIQGNKSAEKEQMLMFLRDQAQLHENYNQIIRNLDDFGCLPTAEMLMNAHNMLSIVTTGNSFYHESVYDSYDRGVAKIKEELERSSPSSKVKTAAEFNKFINELKEIF